VHKPIEVFPNLGKIVAYRHFVCCWAGKMPIKVKFGNEQRVTILRLYAIFHQC